MHGRVGRGGTGVRSRRVACALILAMGAFLLCMYGCRDELTTEVDRNLPPDTYLTGAPAESTTAFYLVHLYWYGDDPDGKVVGYQYAITDSLPADEDTLTYHFTTRTDSLMRFPVASNQQVLGHRFYIRAVDNEGKMDPEPAWTFFAALDLMPPSPVFLVAEAFDLAGSGTDSLESTADPVPTDTVSAGWGVRFRWKGVDDDRMLGEYGDTIPVGDILQYKYSLAPLDVEPIMGGPDDLEVEYTNLTSGKYCFSLQGVDDAGFMGLDPLVRTFVWNRDPQTHFRREWNDGIPEPDSMIIFYATSDAWEDTLSFFEGDTVPLVASVSRAVHPVNIVAQVWGWDPDGDEGGGVSNFQYRLGMGGVWGTPEDTVDNTIELTRLTTSYRSLFARCADRYGRKDGTPAQLKIYINQAPRLRDTLDVASGRLQFPMRDEVVALDSIRAWGDSLIVHVRAWDPDSTTALFQYGLRVEGMGFLFDGIGEPSTEGIFERKIEMRPREGSYTLKVRINEDALYDDGKGYVIRQVPFHVVD
ncbi:MAG: hypothetical protein KAY24_12940 [Candidatus Eisenbacteria sp.]|nr:hypothetical protein [Candidatus Eisenbacteria bacterium]